MQPAERSTDARQNRTRTRVRRGALAAVLALIPAAVVLAPGGALAGGGTNPAADGSFSRPFVEPTVGPGAGYPRVRTRNRCVERRTPKGGAKQPGATHGFIDCKPTAGGINVLANGKVLYWDNLAGTENVEASIGGEYGVVGLNDQSRLLDLKRRTWKDPSPIDGGARNANYVRPFIPNNNFSSTNAENDGALFCAAQSFLMNGDVFANGGTKYRNDPGAGQGAGNNKFVGSTELEGIPNSRIYNVKTNRWRQTGFMHRGRWYPTTVTMGNGKKFTASGLRRLVKPINESERPNGSNSDLRYAPGYGFQEGQNERVTETFDPNVVDQGAKRMFARRFGAKWVKSNFTKGKWFDNGRTARQTLPLFPRMHLLPDGHVFYNAAGQSFAPEGQAYDEALWNNASSYNPRTRRWANLGMPGLDKNGLPVPGALPGFRGSTFSVMMPLVPDRNGRYTKANFLVAGGVTNPPSPGGYFAVPNSDIRTVDTTGGRDKLSTRVTGPLPPTNTKSPNKSGRWYSDGTLLPDGEVLATNGADRDEVVDPGTDIPTPQAVLFNPQTNKWRAVATGRERTYHNTAALLPDGRVLVSGHAVISNNYTRNFTIPGGFDPNGEGRDPTFEIYSPPYMRCPGRQARVTGVTAASRGSRNLNVQLDAPARSIKSVNLVRNTALTHIVDGDQRNVELRVLSRHGNSLTVAGPTNGNLAPPGAYMLFANQQIGRCVKPAVSKSVFVGRSGVVKPASSGPSNRGPGGDKTAIYNQSRTDHGTIRQTGPGTEYERRDNGVVPFLTGGSGGPMGGAPGMLAIAAALLLVLFGRRGFGSLRLAWMRPSSGA